MKPALAFDAKATEHILQKQGIGKLEHIDTACFWVQDEIISKRLRVRRVQSEEYVADLGTKPLRKAVIAKRCLTLSYVSIAGENVECKRTWRCSAGQENDEIFTGDQKSAASHDIRWRLLPSGPRHAGRVREQETRNLCDSAVSSKKMSWFESWENSSRPTHLKHDDEEVDEDRVNSFALSAESLSSFS